MIFREKRHDKSKGFFRRPLLRAGFTAIAGLLAVLAVSCHVIKRTDTYSIELGNCAIYGHFFQKPTQQILQLHDVVCRRNVNCTADWLSKNVNWSGWGAAEWHQALRDDRGTLKSSLDRIRAGREKCLVLKKDICRPNKGNTNFQTSEDSRWCKVGVPVKL